MPVGDCGSGNHEARIGSPESECQCHGDFVKCRTGPRWTISLTRMRSGHGFQFTLNDGVATVTEVALASAAYDGGLRAHDCIDRINGIQTRGLGKMEVPPKANNE